MNSEIGNDYNGLLIVEGKNDWHVTMKICEFHNVEQTFSIQDRDGWRDALKFFSAQIIAANRHQDKIGLVLDANSDIHGRWQAVRNKVKDKYTSFPVSPDSYVIVQPDDPTLHPLIGIWLMPNCKSNGTLENFLLDMVEETNPRACGYVEAVVDKAREDNMSTYTVVQKSKAVMHTWLAWQDEPGQPMGQSIAAGKIEPTTEDARKFIAWLNRLFNE